MERGLQEEPVEYGVLMPSRQQIVGRILKIEQVTNILWVHIFNVHEKYNLVLDTEVHR